MELELGEGQGGQIEQELGRKVEQGEEAEQYGQNEEAGQAEKS